MTTEQNWTLEVTLRGQTFGTEAQAHESAERWRRLLAVDLHGDVELVNVRLDEADGD